MGYNFISEAARVNTSQLCAFDSIIGYEADFTENGNMDSWTYNDGIHTYGCWNAFLFATLYSTQAVIGRSQVFSAIPGEDYYYFQMSMKYKAAEREGSHALPTTGKIRWRTVTDTSWDSDKEREFTLYPDNEWHTYSLNMGESQWWQGDIFDLRIYPTIDGMADDEFFIRTIKIKAVDTYSCNNVGCEYYNNYSNPCQGAGSRGYCISSEINSSYYSTVSQQNDLLNININNYGYENVRLGNVTNVTGDEMARLLISAISKTDIGGYAEVDVVYTQDGAFVIYSGTYSEDSSVVIQHTALSELLGFHDSGGNSLYSSSTGRTPADGFKPYCSYKIKKFQLLSLFDSDGDSSFTFNPFNYNIVGGRIDWYKSGAGNVDISDDEDIAGIYQRRYDVISNQGKTVIDFNHPFNASGRIKKIQAACTLDSGGHYDGGATRDELSGAKIFILRPKRSGNLEVVTSVDINDRDRSSGQLYSRIQECVDIDCDVWVNKGDLLGIYNAEVFVGTTMTGEVDAFYYQITGQPSGEFSPGDLNGSGSSGLLVYARSDEFQRRLAIEVDLEDRVNIDEVKVVGSVESSDLEYNIARCADINWSADCLGNTHTISHKRITEPGTFTDTIVNYPFGEDNLSDGVLIVPDGLAADSYSTNGTYGIVPSNPHYFFVNGDEEWLAIYLLNSWYQYDQQTYNFESDPIAFDLIFPYQKSKTIYRSKIYFKEKQNFRSFELSTYLGPGATYGDSSYNNSYNKVPEYTAVTVDGSRHYEGSPGYDSVSLYLFENPTIGHPIISMTGGQGLIFDPDNPIPDTYSYFKTGIITNNDSYIQALSTDWSTIEHEWEPIECKGFRVYAINHKSTKICEMEVYAVAEDVSTNMIGGVDVAYSDEQDYWFFADLEQDDDENVVASIGGSPRYFLIDIEPITEINLSSVEFTPKIEDMYLGNKGCEYVLLLDDCKSGSLGDSKRIDIQNVYGDSYDLYVDIAADDMSTKSLVFFSEMSNSGDITDPYIGPDGRYVKEDDYDINNQNGNVAINCDCYGLKNLIDGKNSYYSYDRQKNWISNSTLSHDTSIDFSNLSSSCFSKIKIPIISRNRYWKIGFRGDDNSMNLRELKVYYDSSEVDCDLYHETSLDYEDGPISDTAPHLSNDSVTGSYYVVEDEGHIGIDLGSSQSIDELLFYHDSMSDRSPSYGVDQYSIFYMRGNDSVSLDDVVDYSYFEHDITAVGTGISRDSSEQLFNHGAIRFEGHPDSYLRVHHENGPCCNISQSSFELPGESGDYRITGYFKLNSLPTTSGIKWIIFEKTDYSGGGDRNDIFSIYIQKNDSGNYEYCTNMGCSTFAATSGTWYSFFMNHRASGYQTHTYGLFDIMDYRLADTDWDSGEGLNISTNDGVIGRNFDGWIGEIHMSYNMVTNYAIAQTKQWDRFYSMPIYVSDDNVNFGHYCDVDFFYDACINDARYDSDNIYNEDYYSYFAIDLGERHNVDFLRSYGDSDAYYITLLENVIYSHSDTSSVEDVVWSDMFSIPDDLCEGGTANADDYDSTLYPSKAFDDSDSSYWQIIDEAPTGGHWLGYDFGAGNEKIVNSIRIRETSYVINTFDVEGSNDGDSNWDNRTWTHIASIVNAGNRSSINNYYTWHYFENEVAYRSIRIRFIEEDEYIRIINLEMFEGGFVGSTNFQDTRWVGIPLLNGDGTDRYIRKLGIYPNICHNITPQGGSYNTEWESLGKYITNYSTGDNLALSATVSGSSIFGTISMERVNDGIIDYGSDYAWCSDSDSDQWVLLDLGASYSIYRVKIFHGLFEDDDDYLIDDYTVQTSTNNIDFTTQFTITNNTEFERTHDLIDPVTARYVKIDITSYNNRPIYLPTTPGNVDLFTGAALREIEVYEYYGYSVANSELYPIVAIDLNDQFYISGNEIVGTKEEDTTIDWSESTSHFTYSDSIFSDARKISFNKWGTSPNFEQWVVVRRDTATDYQSGPDYMKHVLVGCTDNPNPCDYYWWWTSSQSTLSNSFAYLSGGDMSVSSLHIAYPDSTSTDMVYFLEGDDFGTDSLVSWRDGFYFKLYIDDVSKLDTTFGYFYFGGYDTTDNTNPLIYKWNVSGISLVTGWNEVFLQFKLADSVEYTVDASGDNTDTRRVYMALLKTIGFVFRGKGSAFNMYVEGFKIKRNHFEDTVLYDNTGLYLTGNDYYTCPLGEFDLIKGAIEFWIRPDYTFTSVDYYGDFVNRTLFHFTNTNNDVLGVYVSDTGFEIYYGNLYDLKGMAVSLLGESSIDSVYHFALTYSNKGLISNDGSSLRLYLNGNLVAKSSETWEVAEHKQFNFILGGKAILSAKGYQGNVEMSSVDAVIYGLKMYNYCKTDFSNIRNTEEYQTPSIIKPSSLIQISKDNLTFYSVGAQELPLIYEGVSDGSSVPVYIRTNIPIGLTGEEKRTTGLNIQWNVSV